jgi:hypothetical protein
LSHAFFMTLCGSFPMIWLSVRLDDIVNLNYASYIINQVKQVLKYGYCSKLQDL